MKVKKKKNNKSNLLISITVSLLLVSALVIGAYAAFIKIKSAFPVRRVIFIGNKHLTSDELRTLSGIRRNANLITLSG
jgi:cell division septal protein FtsQ